MTEIELFDRLNPKRDLPQGTCDVISRVYEVMSKENAPKWHYPSKGELPDTKEDERILFFVKDTHDYDGSPYQHFALGFYKAISYKGGKKMFSEQGKGYSCDFLPEEVIAWQYLPEPSKEE